MKTSSRKVPFCVESIIYLVLGQEDDYKAKSNMEITVRGAMAMEEGREFKEMSECAESELQDEENQKAQPNFLMRILIVWCLQHRGCLFT